MDNNNGQLNNNNNLNDLSVKKRNIIIYGIISILFFWFIKFWIRFSNSYSFPEIQGECKNFNDFLSTPNEYSVYSSKYNAWHQNLYTNNYDPVEVQLKCPSYYGEVNLFVNNLLFATETRDESSSNSLNNSNILIKNCKNEVMFILAEVNDSTFKDTITKSDKYIYLYEIRTPVTNELNGFIVKLHIVGLSFSIVDINNNVITEVNHVYSIFSFSLTWNIQIIDNSHKAANSILILALISKKLYNKDLCNEFYLFFEIASYLSFVFVPLLVWVLLKKAEAEHMFLDNVDNNNLIPLQNI